MRSSVTLAALVALVPAVVQAAPQAPRLPRRFEVRPPKGFRPSETPAMLADILATDTIGGYKPHALLYPRSTPSGPIVQVHSELLRSQDRRERAGLRHVLQFASSNGFTITCDDATPAERAALDAAVAELLT
jgi:hypothetical protein